MLQCVRAGKVFCGLHVAHVRIICPVRDVTHVRKCTRPSPALPYCKRREAGRGLGTRLLLSTSAVSQATESRVGAKQTLHTQYTLTRTITLSVALPARSSSSSLTRTHFFFRLPRERGERVTYDKGTQCWYMCQSRVEIEDYSVTYFERIAVLEAPYR